MEEQKNAEDRKEAERKSPLFNGPTVVAALVCFVAALFSAAMGLAALLAPSDVRGSLLINLANGQTISNGFLELLGVVMIALGGAYILSGALLWSKVYWIKGIYFGIMVSIAGLVVSGFGTTFAPGAAADWHDNQRTES